MSATPTTQTAPPPAAAPTFIAGQRRTPQGIFHKIQHRLTAGFGLLVLMFIAVSVYSIFTARGIDQGLRENSEFNSVVQRAAINFRGSAHDRSIAIRDVVVAPNEEALAREQQTIARLAKFYADSNQTLQAALQAAAQVPPEVAPLVKGIETIEARTVATTNQILKLVHQGDDRQAAELLWKDAKPQYEQWLAAINQLIDFLEARIQANTQAANAASAQLPSVMLALCALAVVASGIISFLLSRSILGDLGAEPPEVRAVIRAMQQGDLTVTIPVSPDDNRSVMVALRDMRSRLHSLVSGVHDNIQELHGISAHITDGNQNLASRSSQASESLVSTANNIDNLTQTVHQSADAARQANQLATQAANTAERGGQVMREVVETMQVIQGSSQKISDITSVIDSIAFQTNILALNAAVEAARAGEQGRGFAVVATEVRQLAQRSASAAREIKTLIGSSVKQVESGSGLVHNAGHTMQEIVQSVSRVNDIIAEISAATGEQRNGIEEVNQAVTSLDQMTQQNNTLVGDSSQAAGDLQSQAHKLSSIVAQFHLDYNRPAPVR